MLRPNYPLWNAHLWSSTGYVKLVFYYSEFEPEASKFSCKFSGISNCIQIILTTQATKYNRECSLKQALEWITQKGKNVKFN